MASTYEPIASYTTGSGETSVSFTSIPGTYTDLVIVATGSLTALSGSGAYVRFNSDTGSNYSRTVLFGDSGGAASVRNSSQTYVLNLLNFGTTQSMAILNVMAYANTNVYKTCLASYNYGADAVARTVSLWRSTSAITSISITENDNFSAGSIFSLFGLKAA